MNHPCIPRIARWTPVASLAAAIALAACAPDHAPPVEREPLGAQAWSEDQEQAEALARVELEALLRTDDLGTAADYTPTRITTDARGLRHVRYQHHLNGVPVRGSEAIVHLHADGSVRAVTDKLFRGISVDTAPTLSPSDAAALAMDAIGGPEVLTAPPRTELEIFRHAGAFHLVWRVRLARLDGSPQQGMPVLAIDARDGTEIHRYDDLQTHTATGMGRSNYSGRVAFATYLSGDRYHLEDIELNLGTFSMRETSSTVDPVTDADTTFRAQWQRDAVDAHFGAAATYDYFREAHGRNGVDGAGGPEPLPSVSGEGGVLPMQVHYGYKTVNAYWTGDSVLMGSGDDVTASALTTVDIVAHELTHGVIDHTADLYYYDIESGGLNESYADVFGTLVEQHVSADSGASDWMIAEDCWTPAVPGDALRYMDDPRRDGYSIDHYDDMWEAWDVHLSSGVGNMAFYLLSEGGTHPTYGGAMTGIGTEAAATVWYGALASYLTAYAEYSDARVATVRAAEDVFGVDSNEATATALAWDLVGVY